MAAATILISVYWS